MKLKHDGGSESSDSDSESGSIVVVKRRQKVPSARSLSSLGGRGGCVEDFPTVRRCVEGLQSTVPLDSVIELEDDKYVEVHSEGHSEDEVLQELGEDQAEAEIHYESQGEEGVGVAVGINHESQGEEGRGGVDNSVEEAHDVDELVNEDIDYPFVDIDEAEVENTADEAVEIQSDVEVQPDTDISVYEDVPSSVEIEQEEDLEDEESQDEESESSESTDLDTYDDAEPPPRRGTRVRKPTKLFTYPELGKPGYHGAKKNRRKKRK